MKQSTMQEIKLEDTKERRFYYLTTEKRIVWLGRNMVWGKTGGINKDFVEDCDRFKEIGFDCPYNQLMRKCREKRYPVKNIMKGQNN